MNEYSFLYCKAFNTTSMEKLKIKEVDSMNGAFALVTGLLSLFGHQVLGIREASKDAKKLQNYYNQQTYHNLKKYIPRNVKLEYSIAYDNYMRIKNACDQIDKEMQEELINYRIDTVEFDECFGMYWKFKEEKYGGAYDEAYKAEAIRIANKEVTKLGYKPCIKPLFIGVFWEKDTPMAESCIREIEKLDKYFG